MNETKIEDVPRIERLISMAERLVVALETDIAALKAGKPTEMISMDPGNPEACRCSMAAKRRISTSASPNRRRLRCASNFVAITAKFRDVLICMRRMLTRVKNASEGMIQAIAREVERMNAGQRRTYGPRPGYCAEILRARWFSTKSFDLTRSPSGGRYQNSDGDALRSLLELRCRQLPHRAAIDDGHDIVHRIAAAGAEQRQAMIVAGELRAWLRPKRCRWCCPTWRAWRAARCFSDRCSGCSTARSASCERARSAPVLVEISMVPLVADPGHRWAWSCWTNSSWWCVLVDWCCSSFWPARSARPRRCPAATGRQNRRGRKSGRWSGRHWR